MEYRNDEWRMIGKLNSFKRSTSSISYGDDTMVIGGRTAVNERLAETVLQFLNCSLEFLTKSGTSEQ